MAIEVNSPQPSIEGCILRESIDREHRTGVYRGPNQFSLANALSSPGIITPIRLVFWQNSDALIERRLAGDFH